MAIVKAAVGSFFLNVGQPIEIGIGFFDSDGNTVDVQTFTLPIAPYSSKAALGTALAPQVISYVQQKYGVTITGADILSIY